MSRRRSLLAVVAGAVTTMLALSTADAAFVSTATNLSVVATATLAAASGVSCAWTGTNSLQLSWTNTNGATASGYRQERSDTTGAGFTTLGTTSPASVTTATDSNPAPPTLRYYRLRALAATTWVGTTSAEIVSNTCAGTIGAFAGGGGSSSCSYSGAASGLSLSFGGSGVHALAVDPTTDDLLVFDTSCIRRITPTGTVSPVAGGGFTTSCGTTTASSLSLSGPGGLAVDSSGNVFVADRGNNCIRRIDSGGNVTRVAGGGATSTCGTTTATNLALNGPIGIVVTAGGVVYVADQLGYCIRQISGTTVTAVAGTGAAPSTCPTTGATATATAIAPSSMVSDGAGGLTFTESVARCIVRVDLGTGQLTRVAGGSGAQGSCAYSGASTGVSYSSAIVTGVAVDAAGKVFFGMATDGDPMNRACVVRVSGGTTAQVAGQNGTGSSGDDGPAIAAFLTNPRGMAFDGDGDLYVADATLNLIRRIITP